MTLVQGILLGLLQGITEFLPISSSGHLVLLQNFWNIKNPGVFFEVSVHFGTLMSIVYVYYKDILQLIYEFLSLIKDILSRNKIIQRNNEYRNLLFMIIIGSVPTAFIGILFKDIFSKLYQSTTSTAIMLIITGLILWLSSIIKEGNKSFTNIRVIDGIIIGTAQGLAITPGISRSGSTIVAGLFRGLDRATATRFSFLLTIPAILGATLLEAKDLFVNPLVVISWNIIIAAVITSTISGILAIKILIKVLKGKKLHYFSYYCWAIGLILLVITFLF